MTRPVDQIIGAPYTGLVKEVGVLEAKTHLSDLLRRVEAGEEILIRRGRTVVARLVPAKPAGKRPLGIDAGRFQVPDDFDAPLDPDVLRAFET
jgi:prevent-host-death family protein